MDARSRATGGRPAAADALRAGNDQEIGGLKCRSRSALAKGVGTDAGRGASNEVPSPAPVSNAGAIDQSSGQLAQADGAGSPSGVAVS